VDYHANLSTAPSLGVGLSAAVVAGSHGLVLYDKLGGQEDTRIWTGSLPFSTYPFAPA